MLTVIDGDLSLGYTILNMVPRYKAEYHINKYIFKQYREQYLDDNVLNIGDTYLEVELNKLRAYGATKDYKNKLAMRLIKGGLL